MRSSGAIFREALAGTDNSMGDYNFLPFNFIDDQGLQKEFAAFMARNCKSTIWDCDCGESVPIDEDECWECGESKPISKTTKTEA